MDEEEKRLPQTPGFPHNYEGYEEYEKKLALPCFYTRHPCSRELCPKWKEAKVELFSPLAPGNTETFVLHQCWDDYVDNVLGQVADVIGKITKAAQAAQAQMIKNQLGVGGETNPQGPNFPGFNPKRFS